MTGDDATVGVRRPHESPGDETICVLLAHERNRTLLAEWLAETDGFGVATDPAALEDGTDLVLVDVGGFDAHREAIAAWEAATPAFTPCLLVSEAGEQALDAVDGSLVDGVVALPIGRSALERRLRRFLLQREQSLELEAARQTLATQNDRLETFAGRLAHDLRNPLSIVSGYVEVVQEADDPHDEYFAAIERGLTRMRRLIDETLMLAKMGQTAIEREPVSLRAVAEDAWQTVDTARATLDVLDDVGIEADEGRLLSVFENLYRNAIEHGGEEVSVEVGALPDGFSVTDDGPGIDPHDRASVFEVGFTTNDDGTGFGLRIVQEVVDAHGWTIAIEESARGGARFEITGVDVGDTP